MTLAKLILMNAAATLAAGVITNLPDDLGLDPEISGDKTKAENLMGFRVCHIFYDGLVRAAQKDGWQTPGADLNIGLGEDSPLGKLLTQGLAALAGNSPLASLAMDALKTVVKPSVVAAIPGNIPSPADAVGTAK